MAESDTPVGDEAQRWLNSRALDREGFTPRHKSAEMVATAVLPAVNFIRDEATVLSNIPRLPEIMREQLRYPVQRWAFLALEVLTPIVFGVLSWIYLDNPVPGVILGAYAPIRRIIARSLLQ